MSSAELRLLYRGPLESCNYGCEYCPFAKREDPPELLAADQAALERFVAYVSSRPVGERWSVFFTPWGEALVRPWYRSALVELSRLPNIVRVAVQTNLSVPVDFLRAADLAKVGIWATYHPEWTERRRFVARVSELAARGISVSAGIVGFRKYAAEVEALRAELPDEVYLWINAPKSSESLSEAEIRSFEAIDPYFRLNTKYHPSLGERCGAGSVSVTVDGDGNMRRCFFVPDIIGNLYDARFVDSLRERTCSRPVCGCHIGYVNLSRLGLSEIFGRGILERAPERWSSRMRVIS